MNQRSMASSSTLPTFNRLVEPFNGGRRRTKHQIAHSILEIASETKTWHFTSSLLKYEHVDDYNILRRIAWFLAADGQSCRLLTISKHVTALATSANILHKAHARLFISPRYINPKLIRDMSAFTRVAIHCTEIVVTFREGWSNHEHAPGVVFGDTRPQKDPQVQVNDWTVIFRLCPNLETLTIRTEHSQTGTMWNRTSTALTALRTAFEDAGLSNISSLRFVPADMIYISQFKWSGPSHGNVSPAAADTWSRIIELEVQILPQLDFVNKLDRIQAMKMFNAWLRSMAASLRSLKICYLGSDEGAHPFALLQGLDIKARAQSNMRMPQLRELWLGGVKDTEDYAELLEQLAPELERYRVLIHCDDPMKPVDFGPNNCEEIWRAVHLKIQGQGYRPAKEQKSPSYSARTRSRPSLITSSTRPSTSTSATALSPFPLMVSRTTYDINMTTSDSSPLQSNRVRQTSLPVQQKEKRKRVAPGFTSIFKFGKIRPKSEPSRLPIQLVGETAQHDLPAEFRNANPTSLAQGLARYAEITDLDSHRALRPALRQELDKLGYAPGRVFQAGSGARLPTERQWQEGCVGKSSGQPTPEQIRLAFERLGMQGSSQSAGGMDHMILSSSQEGTEDEFENQEGSKEWDSRQQDTMSSNPNCDAEPDLVSSWETIS